MAQSSSPVEDVEQDKKAAAEQVQHPRKSERRYRFGPHRHRWLSWPRWWREALLVLLLVTAVLCLINPFPKMAFARATAASPSEPLPVSPPTAPEDGYCLAGDFQGWDGRNTLLFDDGTEGDQTAGDGLFARTITFAEPGRYLWRVLPCGDWTQAVPERAAWFFVTTPDQPITFTFRAADVESRFWPNTYALTANDTLPARLVAVGTFQNEPWNNKDTLTGLQPLNSDQFQLAYRVPQPGTYQAYVSVQGRDESVGANGRSMEATPLEFTTRVASEWVLFQYDGRSSRIAVLYQIPWWLGWLGFEHGAQIVAALALVGVFVLAVQVINLWFVKRPDWQSSAGCPTCQGELRRVNRTTTDYLLGLVGIPVRRYKCRQCGWQGRRIHRHH
ncbi:MAG: hypothetical protein H6657_32295 [Ardenticatenaceae bacterium]|nr:hypothetical protein [Ardenticatenaceae bacterium]